MDELAKQWRERFEKIWAEGNYRMGSPGQRLIKYFIQHCQSGQTVNEYGSGTGRAAVELLRVRPGTVVHMVDIAPGAMEPECRAAVDDPHGSLTYITAPIWNLPKRFPHADWGMCVEVLCFLPPEKLDDALGEIRRTCDNLFMTVYDRPDVRCGIDLTTIKMDGEGWGKKLRETWRHVEEYPHPEQARRYLFVCRK